MIYQYEQFNHNQVDADIDEDANDDTESANNNESNSLEIQHDSEIDGNGQENVKEIDVVNSNYGTKDEQQHSDGGEAMNIDNEEIHPEEDDGLKAQDEVDKQRMEKTYRKQEEEWISKRDKVSTI